MGFNYSNIVNILIIGRFINKISKADIFSNRDRLITLIIISDN